jgi:predicted RNA binding protein YcfA (HicA-like mRNA interferase family)
VSNALPDGLPSWRVLRALEWLGCDRGSRMGTHVLVRRKDPVYITTVPDDPVNAIMPHLLKEILEKLRFSDEEFMDALQRIGP